MKKSRGNKTSRSSSGILEKENGEVFDRYDVENRWEQYIGKLFADPQKRYPALTSSELLSREPIMKRETQDA